MLERAAGRYRVLCGDEHVEASLRGRFKQETGRTVVPGDRVELARHDDGSVTIERLRPRTTQLRRRTPGKRRGVRVVAANIDVVIVVASAAEPAWDPMIVDRFLAVVAANGLPSTIVINKTDLADDVSGIAGQYDRIGYPVLRTSAKTGAGVDSLSAAIAGKTAVFTGPTGVGKSSLLNAIQPGLALKTKPVSVKSGAGRHTTVSAAMYPVPTIGGFMIDTPGLRDISLWGLAPHEVEQAFPDIGRVAGGCRFDDCRHEREPDCAVRAAVDGGEIMSSRYASFQKLRAEAAAAARPWAPSHDG